MDDVDETEKKRSAHVRVIVAVLLVLYPFSCGPVAWIANHTTWFNGRTNHLRDAVECFYFPLTPLLKIEPIREFFDWYQRLWM